MRCCAKRPRMSGCRRLRLRTAFADPSNRSVLVDASLASHGPGRGATRSPRTRCCAASGRQARTPMRSRDDSGAARTRCGSVPASSDSIARLGGDGGAHPRTQSCATVTPTASAAMRWPRPGAADADGDRGTRAKARTRHLRAAMDGRGRRPPPPHPGAALGRSRRPAAQPHPRGSPQPCTQARAHGAARTGGHPRRRALDRGRGRTAPHPRRAQSRPARHALGALGSRSRHQAAPPRTSGRPVAFPPPPKPFERRPDPRRESPRRTRAPRPGQPRGAVARGPAPATARRRRPQPHPARADSLGSARLRSAQHGNGLLRPSSYCHADARVEAWSPVTRRDARDSARTGSIPMSSECAKRRSRSTNAHAPALRRGPLPVRDRRARRRLADAGRTTAPAVDRRSARMTIQPHQPGT